jgi:hypothetical protein
MSCTGAQLEATIGKCGDHTKRIAQGAISVYSMNQAHEGTLAGPEDGVPLAAQAITQPPKSCSLR